MSIFLWITLGVVLGGGAAFFLALWFLGMFLDSFLKGFGR